jgi:hypothetical protein
VVVETAQTECRFSAIKLLIEEIVDAHLSAFSSALFVTRLLAVLVLVFVPLELYKNTEISHAVVVGAIMGSIALAGLGILIEWLRK